jgi:excisionase family DNA binding protein
MIVVVDGTRNALMMEVYTENPRRARACWGTNGEAKMEQLLYTERETIERLRMPRTSLRREMARGRIHAIRIGRALRFSAAELHRYVAELQGQATAQNDDRG